MTEDAIGPLFDCVRCKQAMPYADAVKPCRRAPDGGPHEGLAPPGARQRGWSLHGAGCPRGEPFVIGHELVDAACTCRKGSAMSIESLFDCAIVGCRRPAEWRVLGTDELVGFCRHHRDLIEDEGLDLIEYA